MFKHIIGNLFNTLEYNGGIIYVLWRESEIAGI